MSEGGGGHGGNWIVTYADMITLLMAGFIVIVTFGSRETDKLTPRQDSVIGSQAGTGIVGMTRKGPDKDHVVVRKPPLAGNAYDRGSEMPALYTDVPLDVTKSVEASLEASKAGKLSDNYEVCYPFGLMFDNNTNDLSAAGTLRLQQVNKQIRNLHYDILIQVNKPGDYLKAMRVYDYLFETCGMSPLRLGVGLTTSSDSDGKLLLSFRHPTR